MTPAVFAVCSRLLRLEFQPTSYHRCTLVGREVTNAAPISHYQAIPSRPVAWCFKMFWLAGPLDSSASEFGFTHCTLLWPPSAQEFLLPVLVLSLKVVSAFFTPSFLWLYEGERVGMSEIVTPVSTSRCKFVL